MPRNDTPQTPRPAHDGGVSPPGENPAYLREQIPTYIGNKRLLLPVIGECLATVKRRLGRERMRCLDAFSGSGVVARYLKAHSTDLAVCDLERYTGVVNTCYLANRGDIDTGLIADTAARVNRRTLDNLAPGFITELYAPADDTDIRHGERVFYTRRNAMFIDTARQVIGELGPELQPFLLAPLLYKASVHANTAGVFKGFYKNSATGVGQFGGNGRHSLRRILGDITIPVPVFSRFSTRTTVLLGDANTLVRTLPAVDLAYLDPPYNQHPYGSNYFMLNLIASYRRPPRTSRISGIPPDWNRSDYYRPRAIREALRDLIGNIRSRFLLVSFNSEGFISHREMTVLLEEAGRVETHETRYNAYRGSRNLRNRDIHVREYLYLVDRG